MRLFLILFPGFCLADMTVDSLFLVPSDAFPVGVYRQILSSFGPTTILSVQPDTMTGAEALRNYFPNRTDVFRFQLLHVTRVQASVAVNTTLPLAALLPALCAQLGPMVVVPPGDSPAAFDWLALFPPIVAPLALGAWILTVLSCGACWLVVWCRPPVIVPTATPVVGQFDPCATPRKDPGPAAVRLVLSSAAAGRPPL